MDAKRHKRDQEEDRRAWLDAELDAELDERFPGVPAEELLAALNELRREMENRGVLGDSGAALREQAERSRALRETRPQTTPPHFQLKVDPAMRGRKWTDNFTVDELVGVARAVGLDRRLRAWYWTIMNCSMPSQKLRFCRVLGLYLWHLTEEDGVGDGLGPVPRQELPMHVQGFLWRFEPYDVGTAADRGPGYNGPFNPPAEEVR